MPKIRSIPKIELQNVKVEIIEKEKIGMILDDGLVGPVVVNIDIDEVGESDYCIKISPKEDH